MKRTPGLQAWGLAATLGLALLAGGCAATAPRTESGPTAAAAPRPLLWVAERDGRRLYLLGSMHLLPGEEALAAPAVQAALADAERLLFEIDPAEMGGSAAQQSVLSLARDPQGRTLSTIVGPERYPRLAGLAITADLSLQGMEPFEPWFAAIVVAMQSYARAGFDPKHGTEATLAAAAAAQGKPVGGLETLEGQLGIFDSLPEDAQVRQLELALEELPQAPAQIAALLAAWRAGDAKALEKLMLDDPNWDPALRERLIDARNRAWVEPILAAYARARADGQDLMVVVGAGHLIGPGGVPALLRARGVKSRRL